MGTGLFAPALEAGFRPIAVSAANIDRAQLAEHQQDLIEMLGRCVVGIDQEGNIVFRLAVAVAHQFESPSS